MRLEKITENFQIDPGAPTPIILSNEDKLFLFFYTNNTKADEFITLRFDSFAQFKFGNPNDESITGHHLYELGLEPYSIQKVINSKWIKELVEMNSVHPYHKDEDFENYNHFILFFHDTCFEIVAEKYIIETISTSNIKNEIMRVAQLL